MKSFKEILPKATLFFVIFTIICGLIYTLAVTGFAAVLFPNKANGSIIEVDGKKYGSALLGQQYTDDAHVWGRVMKIDTSTFTDKDGNAVMYSAPSNLSPASEEYKALIAERVEKLKASNPSKNDTPIPVDLITGSGSGLDPHISVAAAEYQIDRIVENTDYSAEQVAAIIEKYTTGRFLGIFGEPVVNVLKVNLALDGILK